MQYELTEQEARHMDRFRALTPTGQGALELFMDRLFSLQSEMDRAAAERKSAAEE